MDFDSMLDSNKKTKADTKTKKSSAEIIAVPAEVQVEIDTLLKAKKAKKKAESDIKKSESPIIEHGITLKDGNAYDGKFQKSYKLGNDDSHVNFVTANKWSFKEEDVKDIKSIIDDADGDSSEMIIEHKEVKLKAEVFKDDELKAKFVEMVGQAFPEFFETVVSHSVSADFDEKIYKLGEGAVEDLKVLMKQSKPSLR